MARPVLLCDDGSEEAAIAVTEAAGLLRERQAIALHVWQQMSTLAFTGVGAGMPVFPPDVDDQLAAKAETTAREAAERARDAGFSATSRVVAAVGPIWQAIVDAAHENDAAVIVMGARGLTGLQHVLLGSVSERVVRHADRPVLVLRRSPGSP
jgi:nucleotide-binding universal stress UspA family protein